MIGRSQTIWIISSRLVPAARGQRHSLRPNNIYRNTVLRIFLSFKNAPGFSTKLTVRMMPRCMQLILGRGDQGIAEGETKPVFDGVGLIDGMSARTASAFLMPFLSSFRLALKIGLISSSVLRRNAAHAARIGFMLSTSLSKWACRVPYCSRPYKGLVRAAASPTAK